MKIKSLISFLLFFCILGSMCVCQAEFGTGIDMLLEVLEEVGSLEQLPDPLPTPEALAEPEALPTIAPEADAEPEPSPEPTAEPAPVPVMPSPQADSFLTGMERAAYLRFSPYSELTTDELRSAFVNAALSGIDAQLGVTEDISAICESKCSGTVEACTIKN